ncbi:MAG: hypothetical protein U5M23_00365 [Marinagarivorans sp.]|nr:hypothetical protein [Marinagarivorans sp.]
MERLQGLAYPLALDGKGNLMTACDEKLIGNHIISMLEIEPKENPMRPTYGIDGTLFASQRSTAAYSAYVARHLKERVPQADISVSGQVNDDGSLDLLVLWRYDGVAQNSIFVRQTV